MRRNLKKLTAVALTAAMTMASAMTAFAAGELSGDGSYEGGEMKYPAISVTLPTVPQGLGYIADPNDLITLTASGDAAKAAYKGYDFSGDAGIYFMTKQKSGDAVRGLYSDKSAPMTITNENAQDLNVTVKLSKKSEASGDVVYSDSAVFEASDTANKLYLAITDGSNTKSLEASGDATFTTEVAGNKTNFEPKYDASGDAYGYVKKSGDLSWSSATYELTGAINKNAKWEDGYGFPSIEVTWSYVEKPDEAAPSINNDVDTIEYTLGSDLVIPYSLGAGTLKAEEITDVIFDWGNGTFHSVNGTASWAAAKSDALVIGSNSITIKYDDFLQWCDGSYAVYVILDGDESGLITLTVNCN